jgi:hypothetical protein
LVIGPAGAVGGVLEPVLLDVADDVSGAGASEVEGSGVELALVSVVELVSVGESVLVVSAGVLVSVTVGSVGGVVPSAKAALGAITSSIAIAKARSVDTKRASGFWCRNATRDRIRVSPVGPAVVCFFICGPLATGARAR